MTLKQIEGFCYLAQTLNFSKAAEMLYITQPAFSRMIVSLEEELECQLFVRSKTKPQLTLAGEQIYKHMKTMLRDYGDIRSIAKLAGEQKLGILRIGMLDNGMTRKCRNMIYEFHREYPNVTLEIKEYSEVEMFHALEMDWIDAAFVIHYPKIFKEMLEELIVEETTECLVIHKSHPLAQKETVAIEELKDIPFVMLRENRSELGYNMIMTTCLESGFTPDIVTKVDSVAGALTCVECNMGCIILADILQPLADQNVVFVPVKDAPKQKVRMIWKKQDENKTASLFRMFTEAHM